MSVLLRLIYFLSKGNFISNCKYFLSQKNKTKKKKQVTVAHTENGKQNVEITRGAVETLTGYVSHRFVALLGMTFIFPLVSCVRLRRDTWLMSGSFRDL